MTIERIRFRRGTAAAWTTSNPVLATGEPGFERDTGKVKLGDGTTAWADLDYFAGDAELPDLATVATTGAYADLSGKPTIPTVPTLAPVATSGDYEDLDNTPAIPTTAADVGAVPASEAIVLPVATPTIGQTLVVATVDPLTFAWGTGTAPDPAPDPDPPTVITHDYSTLPTGITTFGTFGSLSVASGHLQKSAGNSFVGGYVVDCGSESGTVEVVCAGDQAGAIFWWIDASNYCMVRDKKNVYKVVADVPTLIINGSGDPSLPVTQQVLLDANVGKIDLYLNGASSGTYTDAALPTSAFNGVFLTFVDSGQVNSFTFTPPE